MNTSTTDNGSTPDHNDRLRVGPATYTKGGYIRFGRYASGEIAMEILDDADEPQCVATVSLARYGGPHPGEYGVWLKGYSENDGVPQALVDAGIVTLTGRRQATGYAEAEHADLTLARPWRPRESPQKPHGRGSSRDRRAVANSA